MVSTSCNVNFKGNNIMALNKNANTSGTPSFEEGMDGENIETNTTTQMSAKERLAATIAAEKAAQEKAAAESKSTEVATTKAGAGSQVAVAKPMIDPLESLEGAFPVEYDTLLNLQLNQGNVINKATNKPIGDEIGLELLSFQKQWVCSPGVDGDAAKEHVRYSDDGITSTKGENMLEHLANLKSSGFDKASISERQVIVGSLFDPGTKGKDVKGLADTLVQINLPPTTVAAFKRYRMDQAFKIRKGLAQAEGADRVRITCDIVTKGDNTWTVGEFSRYDA